MSEKSGRWKQWTTWPWWGKGISFCFGIVVVFGVFNTIRHGRSTASDPTPPTLRTQPTPPTARARAGVANKSRALENIRRVGVLALYLAGTKTETECAASSVEMTRAFVQASTDAEGWTGLSRLRQTYEASCVAICEQAKRTGCFEAIVADLRTWKKWIEGVDKL